MKQVNENARLLSLALAASYIGIGRNNARAWLEEINAARRFGARVVYDRRVIDKALDDMAKQPATQGAANK